MQTQSNGARKPTRAKLQSQEGSADIHAALSATLGLLDQLLGLAVDRTARMLGPATLLDPWRGMHLDADEVRRVLASERGVSLISVGPAEALAQHMLQSEAIGRLCRCARFNVLDVAIVAIVLAPDIDLRYERIYAYLQDDISRKRPTPDLLANLLCTSPAGRLQLLSRLDAEAPLQRYGVVQPCASPEGSDLARPLRIARVWMTALTGRATAADNDLLDAPIERAAIDPDVATRAQAAIEATSHRPLRFVLQGPHGAGKHALARFIAATAGLSLLPIDVHACTGIAELQSVLRDAFNQALVRHALTYIHGAGRLQGCDPQLLRTLQVMLADESVNFVLAISVPLPLAHGVAVAAERITVDFPSPATRERAWSVALQRHSVVAAPADIRSVASRFVLSGAQIAQAAVDVAHRVRVDGKHVDADDLAAAARALCGDELARLAQRVRPQAGFGSLVAAREVEMQLREICARVTLRERVRCCWIGDSVHGRSAGINALFAGPSGTGKTLAAEIVARELGLDLFRIDLSAVVSKYIGETEKNLDRIFAAAVNANAVLFFDEADALFGKRSEVKDAHDRYANIEIAYLLQKIEQFDGVAILATNLKQNLDEAFTRRLTFCVNFAFPEEAERIRLWHALWPPSAPRTPDVDFVALAREYRVSGGNIRNIVIASAYLAAADGEIVTREHVLHATRREYQKLGKTVGSSREPMRQAAA